MRKVYLSVITTCLYCLHATAQLSHTNDVKKQLETQNKDTVAWTHNGVLDVGFNEGFLHNWTAGGEIASMNINGIFSGNLTRLNHKDVWSNSLDLSYGLYYAYSNSFVPRKTDDRIDFTSKYGFHIDSTGNFFITGLFNFKSQFTRGFDYTLPEWDTSSTSRFFSPAYFTLAAGAEYRQGSDVSFFLSPAAGRLTVASRYYTTKEVGGAFGIPYGKTTRYDLGAYFSGRYVWNVNKNMVFKTRADLYCNYLAKDLKDSTGRVIKRDNPGNISILCDNLLSWKLTKFLNMTIGVTIIYDNDIPYSTTYVDATGIVRQKNEPINGLGWLQVKQIFSLGLEYKF